MLVATIALFCLGSAAAFRGVTPARPARGVARSRHSDRSVVMRDDEPTWEEVPGEDEGGEGFGDRESMRQWYRTGKGVARWRPGDKTGDTLADSRLMWTTWVISPLDLHIRDGDPHSVRAQLVLGSVGMPFDLVSEADERWLGHDQAAVLPVLSGPGVPSLVALDALGQSLEICSFGAAAGRNGPRCAPATGRADVADWLARFEGAAAGERVGLLTDLLPVLRGKVDTDDAPCVNAWGWSMDDAFVLPALISLARSGPTDGWPEEARTYLEASAARCKFAL